MMRDPQFTRSHIINVSADLFNTKGYKSTSLSDITAATGFTKGAIYKHFKNKEELEQAALNSLAKTMFTILGSKIQSAPGYKEKMQVVFEFFERYLIDPPYAGGCPLLNCAIEVDDQQSALRERTMKLLQNLKRSISQIMNNGLQHGQIKADIDVEHMTYVFIATLEGAIMMSKLENNNQAMTHCINHLKQVNQNILT
jgi:AcrR family transcriptional regulator